MKKEKKDKILQRLEILNQIDRFRMISVILIVMLIALALRLGYLTLIRGSYYNDVAQNNRIKEITIPAARGVIYDRKGNILSGTRTVFTAAIATNTMQNIETVDKNADFRQLARMFDKEGANYYEEYTLSLNMFHYRNPETYFSEEKSPTEKIVDIFLENDLMDELMAQSFQEETDHGVYEYNVLNQIIASLRLKGIKLPIIREGSDIRLKEGEETELFLRDHNLIGETEPRKVIYQLVKQDEGILRKILIHPVGRALAYDLLKARNLQDNVLIQPVGIEERENYYTNKSRLSRSYGQITLDSDAKSDFAAIVDESTLDKLLLNVSFDKENRIIVPAQKALDLLKDKGIKHGLSIHINEEDKNNPKVELSFEEGEEKETSSATEYLLLLLRENNLVKDLVTDDTIKSIAQEINTQNNINPRISIVEWEYMSQKAIREAYKRFKVDEKESPESLYQAVLKYYEIENEYKYDAFNIIMFYYRISNHTSGGYEPLHIAYDLGESIVAQIKEYFSESDGITVKAKPVRYYPNGNLAAHALGYMGKISTGSEIERFINKEKYNPTALIGKTGIEESQEGILRGKDGTRRVYVDNKGNTTEVLGESAPAPGNNIYLTLDMELQKTAEISLQKTLNALQTGQPYESIWGSKHMSRDSEGKNYKDATSASAVVLDVKSGEVLAMANAPNYDPNLFSTGISQSDWQSLMPENEEDTLAPRPLYNTAIQSAIQPGSIFKLASSLTALEKGMDPDKKIKCDGHVTVGNRNFGCWIWNRVKGKHGYEGVREALRDSCNYYYYSLALGENQGNGEKLDVQLGIEELNQMSAKLGLGSPTGVEIQIPRESSGILPDPVIKEQNTKVLFKRYLEADLNKYLKEDSTMTQEDVEKHIETIVSWLDEDAPLSRTEVITRLDELGFKPEEPLEGKRQGLADIIKFDYLNQVGWTMADMMNVVIGQGQQAYTPLQMASYVSIFANDGYKYKTTLINEIKDANNEKLLFENQPQGERVPLNNYDNLKVVREGMRMAAKDGTDRLVFEDLSIDIGVKTGTAQREGKNPSTGEDYDEYAWMVAFAPYDDPKIAVATMITQGGTSSNAGPMTRDIIGQALNLYPKNNIDQEVQPASQEPQE
ncbi:MAG: penicillin-binding transpeptidase domain-containing protein [Gallicola sp.]|nr:penicillin-binding transpeptidase domain-containing protein [Gallicola sp.]